MSAMEEPALIDHGGHPAACHFAEDAGVALTAPEV